MKVHFLADEGKEASRDTFKRMTRAYGQTDLDKAEIIVPIGGDGLMLRALPLAQGRYVYGIVPEENNSTGFAMNPYPKDHDLKRDLDQVGFRLIAPLKVSFSKHANGGTQSLVKHAFNSAALVSDSGQAAMFDFTHVTGKEKITTPIGGNGLVVSTGFGSTGLNFTSGGAILDIFSSQVVVTGINLFQPRSFGSRILARDRSDFVISWQEGRGKRPLRLDIDGLSNRDLANGRIEIGPEKDARNHAKIGFLEPNDSPFKHFMIS